PRTAGSAPPVVLTTRKFVVLTTRKFNAVTGATVLLPVTGGGALASWRGSACRTRLPGDTVKERIESKQFLRPLDAAQCKPADRDEPTMFGWHGVRERLRK